MIADSADIRFECHHCGQHLVVEAAGAGLTTDCPICNTTVTVPAKSPGKTGEGTIRAEIDAAQQPAAPRPPYADMTPDEQREELIDASLINGKLLGDLNKARDEIGRLQQQLKARAEEHEHLLASTTHTQAELKTFQSERAQLKGEVATLRQRLTSLEETLTARDAALTAAEKIAAERQAKATAEEKAHSKAQRYGDEWRDKAKALETALGEAKALSGERATGLKAAESAARKAKELATKLEARAASLQQALAAEHTQRDQLAAELAEKRRELSDIHRRITERKNELHAARNRVTELEALLASAKQAHERLEAEAAGVRGQLDEARAEVANAGDLKARLGTASGELDEHRVKLRASEEAGQILGKRCEDLRRECDSLRRDLAESHAGREVLEIRAQLDGVTADRDRAAARVHALERDLHAFATNEAELRAELDRTSRARDEAAALATALGDSRTVKDNEVLRGIVARLNGEITQRTGEVHRLRRARYFLKIAYVIFGIGLLAVIIFAIIVLPHALQH